MKDQQNKLSILIAVLIIIALMSGCDGSIIVWKGETLIGLGILAIILIVVAVIWVIELAIKKLK